MLALNSCVFVFADEGEEETPELFVDGTEINAITDYSTYGAADVTEMSTVNYLDKNRFTDIKDNALLKKVSLLSTLGIMNGTGDGLFEPDAEFTRIQFVLTSLRIMNYDVSAHTGDKVDFYDLPSDYAYLPEVEAAVDLGIITGFSDKTLRPDEPIAYQDAVTIMLRLMGYTTPAYSKGGYPNGFLTVASELNLYNGINFSEDGKFTRANAAGLLYNCLHTDVLYPIQGGPVSQLNSKGTVLKEFFDIYYTTGIINSTYLAYLYESSASRDNTVIIGGETYYCDNQSYGDYLGKRARVYYKLENESDKRVCHLELYNDEEEVIIKSDDIVSFDNYTIKYYDGKKLKTVEIDTGHNLIYNGKRKISYDKDIFKPENGFVRLLRTYDYKGKEFNVVFVNEYFNFYVQSLSANGSILTISPKGNSSGIVIDMAKSNFLMEIYDQNGKMSTELSVTDTYDNDGNLVKKYLVPPIPAGSLLSIFTDEVVDGINGHKTMGKNATYIKVYINNASIDGTLEEIYVSDNSLAIDDKECYISSDNYLFGDNEIKIGDTGTFLFDFNGKIAAFAPAGGDDKYIYGYLIQASAGNNFNPSYKFRVLKTNGSIEIFDGVPQFKLNGERVKSAIDFNTELKKSAQYLDPDFKISQIIKYKLNEENRITDVQTVTASVGIAEGYETTQLNRHSERAKYQTPQYFGGALKSTTGTLDVGRSIARYAQTTGVYFVVPDSETFDEDDYTVKANTYYFSGLTNADVFDCNDSLSPAAVVLYTKTELMDNDPPFIVVDQKIETIDEDGYECSGVSGVDGYRETEFYGHTNDIFDAAKAGDIYFCKGSRNVIKDAEKIASVYDVASHDYNSSEYISETISCDSETLYCTPLEVYDYNATSRTFVLQLGPDEDGDGKRELQRACYWSNLEGTFRYGCVTCNIYEGGIELAKASANDIRAAKKFGHSASTKIFVVESANMRYFVLVNDYR